MTHLFSGVLLWSLPPVREPSNPPSAHNFVRVLNGFQYYVRPKAHCEYDNGYLVFDRIDGCMEVWRLACDVIVGGEEAAHASPPDEEQRLVSTAAATTQHRYAPRGHFRPWAKISFPEVISAYRVVYPTLLCANNQHAFLYDLRTGALVQTIKVNRTPQEVGFCHVDMDERHVFVCEFHMVHVFARDRGTEVFRLRNDMFIPKMKGVAVDAGGDAFVESLSLHRSPDDFRPDFLAGALPFRFPRSPGHAPIIYSFFGTEIRQLQLTIFWIAHISGDGRDLAILTTSHRVLLYRDFERIRRGEIGPVAAGRILSLMPGTQCPSLSFEHRRLCVATVRVFFFPISRYLHSCPPSSPPFFSVQLHALYIFNLDEGHSITSAKVVVVQPYLDSVPTSNHEFSCMQLTDRRIYFTWEDARRRDVPLFKDEEDTRPEPSSSEAMSTAEPSQEAWVNPEFGGHSPSPM